MLPELTTAAIENQKLVLEPLRYSVLSWATKIPDFRGLFSTKAV
jgi:hypothetical protein